MNSFNLVIERLLFSTSRVPVTTTSTSPFQSRNRETSIFNGVDIVGNLLALLFQSRNRETSIFNKSGVSVIWLPLCTFQSRNRETSIFNQRVALLRRGRAFVFQSRNRETSIFNSITDKIGLSSDTLVSIS